jgi:hypothetical protein
MTQWGAVVTDHSRGSKNSGAAARQGYDTFFSAVLIASSPGASFRALP